MDDSRNQPELETLSYKQKCNKCGGTGRIYETFVWKDCPLCKPKPLSYVPEHKCIDCQTNESGGVLANPEQLPGRLHTKECECGNCPEQPNQNPMIITEIEGLMSQVNDKLGNIVITQELPGDSVRKLRRSQALEEIDLFQKTMLFELRKAFE